MEVCKPSGERDKIFLISEGLHGANKRKAANVTYT